MKLDEYSFRSMDKNPEAWKQFTFLFENRDRLYPFLVIHDDTLIVCDSIPKVMRYDDADVVLKQWPGQYRSDWFNTTVGTFRKKLQEDSE